jgi:hypothetical protein
MLIVPLVVLTAINYSTPCYADKEYLARGDFVHFGFQLYWQEVLQDTRTELNPVEINFTPETTSPPGLYDVLLGMKNGAIKELVIITPADGGYESSDPDYGYLEGEVVEFRNLQIYEINGFYYTDVFPPGGGNFGRTLLIIVGVVLGLGAVVGSAYVIYRFSPKIFGKRCLTCKSLAVGKCRNCGKSFCEKCFSNGCPSCKGRSLIRSK